VDWILRAVEVAFIAAGGASAIYAAKLWVQAQKYRAITEAKDEAIRISGINAEAWKSHYQAAHLELNKYREEQHTRNDESNAKILSLTDENAQLRAKTDLSPVMKLMQDFFKEQTAINEKILAALIDLERRIGKGRRKPARLTKKRGS
jgi:hypothetical protein